MHPYINIHSNWVSCLALINKNLLASGSYDDTINLWDLNNKQCIHIFNGHSDKVRCLALINKNLLASGSDDMTIRL